MLPVRDPRGRLLDGRRMDKDGSCGYGLWMGYHLAMDVFSDHGFFVYRCDRRAICYRLCKRLEKEGAIPYREDVKVGEMRGEGKSDSLNPRSQPSEHLQDRERAYLQINLLLILHLIFSYLPVLLFRC